MSADPTNCAEFRAVLVMQRADMDENAAHYDDGQYTPDEIAILRAEDAALWAELVASYEEDCGPY